MQSGKKKNYKYFQVDSHAETSIYQYQSFAVNLFKFNALASGQALIQGLGESRAYDC